MEFTADKQDYTLNERLTIVWRCVLNRCPRCQQGGISKPFRFPDTCPSCQMIYERGNGFLLAALPAVYFGYAVFWVVPMLIAFLQGWLSFDVSMWSVGIGAVVIPTLFFNYCKMLALALYHFFLPAELFYRPEAQAAPAPTKPQP
jgi:uncharacterized protein (DUF983 family)